MANPAPFAPVDVVLHIGSGKTGTTTLQRVLRRNPDAFLRSGHLYPRAPGHTRHTRLGLYVRPDDELVRSLDWRNGDFPAPDEFRRRFRRRLFRELAAAGADGVVFSDEGLFGTSERAMARMRRFTDRFARSVKVVVYLRRQDDHLVSRYQQVVKMGEIAPLATWADRDWTGVYDYHRRLSAWRQHLEPAGFVVRRFERDRFVGGSLVADFLDATGIPVPMGDLADTEPRNESIGAEGIELLRILNLYRVEHEGAEPLLFGNHEHVGKLRGVPTGPVLTLPTSDLDRFMGRWAEANRQVAREFLADRSGELFAAPRKSRDTTTEQRLDPARLDGYLELLEIPDDRHAAIRRIAEREAMR